MTAPVLSLSDALNFNLACLVEFGDRMLIPCDGSPTIARAGCVLAPPEVELAGGVNLLVDDGPPEHAAS